MQVAAHGQLAPAEASWRGHQVDGPSNHARFRLANAPAEYQEQMMKRADEQRRMRDMWRQQVEEKNSRANGRRAQTHRADRQAGGHYLPGPSAGQGQDWTAVPPPISGYADSRASPRVMPMPPPRTHGRHYAPGPAAVTPRASLPVERAGMEEVISIMHELKRDNERIKHELDGLVQQEGGRRTGLPAHGRRSKAPAREPRRGYAEPPHSAASTVISESPYAELDAPDEEILQCFYSYMDPALCSEAKLSAIIGGFRQKWGGSRRRPNGTLWRDKMYEKIGEKRGVDPREFFLAEQRGEAHMYIGSGVGEKDDAESHAQDMLDRDYEGPSSRGDDEYGGDQQYTEPSEQHGRRVAPRTPNSELDRDAGYNVQNWASRPVAESTSTHQAHGNRHTSASGHASGGPVVSRRAMGQMFSPRSGAHGPMPQPPSDVGTHDERDQPNDSPPPIPPQEYGFNDYYSYGDSNTRHDNRQHLPPQSQHRPMPPSHPPHASSSMQYAPQQQHRFNSAPPHPRLLEQLGDDELQGMLRAARIDPRGLRTRDDVIYQLRAVIGGLGLIGGPVPPPYGGGASAAAPNFMGFPPARASQQSRYDYGYSTAMPAPTGGVFESVAQHYGQPPLHHVGSAGVVPQPGAEVPGYGHDAGQEHASPRVDASAAAAAVAAEERRLSGKGQASYELPEVRFSVAPLCTASSSLD